MSVTEAPSTTQRVPFPRWLIAALVIGAGAVLFGLLARFLLYVPYLQPSGSMYPTVAPGAYMLVNRLDTTPTRGAVMVFRHPEHPAQRFDKRIVGLPGDTVLLDGRRLFVNGWEVPRCTVGAHAFADPTGASRPGVIEIEFLGDASYLLFHDDEAAAVRPATQGPFAVNADEYFVVGDNRDNSHDSRTWFVGRGGGVPFEHTVGRVRYLDAPKLPAGAEDLAGALEACLAKRPAQTTPPAP
jgi:signal peptidase I